MVGGGPANLHGVAALTARGVARTRSALSLLPSLVGWVLVAAAPECAVERLPPERWEPRLPAVSAPYEYGSDVVSLVPNLFVALTLGAAACLLVEFSKAVVVRCSRLGIVKYVVLTLMQIGLIVDALRAYAADWYVYILHFARVAPLSWQKPWPEILPLPSPWPSFFLLAISVALAFVIDEKRSASRAGAPTA